MFSAALPAGDDDDGDGSWYIVCGRGGCGGGCAASRTLGVAAAAEVIGHIGPRPKRPLTVVFAEAGLR